MFLNGTQQGSTYSDSLTYVQPASDFSFGGSSVVTLFEQHRLRIADDLREYTEANIETYAKMGDELGRSV